VTVPERRPSRAIRFARASAHPSDGPAAFRLELPERALVDVAVHDASGRRVAVLALGERDAGSHALVWDGRDASGREVAAGVYFVRARSGAFDAVQKTVRLR
jgi:flagellar hook assembly protein FlgD